MDWMQAIRRARRSGFPLWATMAAGLGGCANGPALNPFVVGGVNPDSTVQAEVVAAMHSPGTTPNFSQVPVVPTDVRPVPAWREAVLSEWAQKRRIEKEAAAIPFSLANAEEWARRTRAKIPANQSAPPSPRDASEIEAFAAAARARATPPPPPQ